MHTLNFWNCTDQYNLLELKDKEIDKEALFNVAYLKQTTLAL